MVGVMDDASRDYQLFKRREKAVRKGARLPTEEELLRGMPFFRDDLRDDMREYGDRLARRLRRRQRLDLQPLVACLEELTVEQSYDSLRAFEATLSEVQDAAGLPIRPARLRCLIYRAGFGDVDAAAAAAGEMALLAMKDAETIHKPRMLRCALAWSAFSRDMAEQLLEPATDAAVKHTLSRLDGLSMAGPGMTIEALVRDMLRPMLKEWLDENLPSVVERMVEKEIARVSRGRD